MITSPVHEFEPPSRLQWLCYMAFGLGLCALIIRGAVGFWHDIF